MVGIRLTPRLCLMAGYIIAQAMRQQTRGEGPRLQVMPCNCKIDDQRCRDLCSGGNAIRSGNPHIWGAERTPKQAVVTVREATPHKNKPFIRFVEKNIERNMSNKVFGIEDGASGKLPEGVLDTGDNTVFYKGSVYRICDLHSWAAQHYRSRDYLSMANDLRILYDYVRSNPKVERICKKDSSEYLSTSADLPDSISALPSLPLRVPVGPQEPMILERNNVIPVFINGPFGTSSESVERSGSAPHPNGSGDPVSVVTLKMTSTTTTTTKVRKQESLERMAVKKIETQTMLTTRTVTRQRDTFREPSDTTRTILKTIFIGGGGQSRAPGTEGDQASDPMPPVLSKRTRRDGYEETPNSSLDIQILEKIKSLLNLASPSISKSASAVSALSMELGKAPTPQTTTLTIEKPQTTTIYRAWPTVSSVKEPTASLYDDLTRELVKSIFSMLKNTTASESKTLSLSSIRSTVIRRLTTTVTETTTRVRNYTLTGSAASEKLPRSIYILPTSARDAKDSTVLAHESYRKKLDELYKRISVDEEKNRGLASMIMSIERKEKSEDNTLELLKKLYELYKDGPGYASDTASHLSSEGRSSSSITPRSVKPGLGDASRGKISNLVANGRSHLGALVGAEKEAYPIALTVSRKSLWPEKVTSEVSVTEDGPRSLAERSIDIGSGERESGMSEDEVKDVTTEYKTVTETTATTVIKEFDSRIHLDAMSSVVEGHVRRLEKKLGGFSDKVDQIENRLRRFRSIPEREISLGEQTISSTVPGSSIFRNRSDALTKANPDPSGKAFSTIHASSSTAPEGDLQAPSPPGGKPVPQSLSPTLSRPPQMIGLGEDEKKEGVDGVVERIKEKKIPSNSLLISDDVVIDEIVEKLAPLVNDITVSSLCSSATATQGDIGPPQSVA